MRIEVGVRCRQCERGRMLLDQMMPPDEHGQEQWVMRCDVCGFGEDHIIDPNNLALSDDADAPIL